MLNTNITQFRKNLLEILEQTIKFNEFNEPIQVSTSTGNVIILNEKDYNGLIEALSLCSMPGMKAKLVDGMNTPLSECVTEDDVEW